MLLKTTWVSWADIVPFSDCKAAVENGYCSDLALNFSYRIAAAYSGNNSDLEFYFTICFLVSIKDNICEFVF